MQTHSLPRFRLFLLSLSLITLLSACGAASPSRTTSPVQATSMTSDTARVDMPATQTSCPSTGTGRAAVFVPLAGGSDEQIVYVDTTRRASALKRYAVSTGVVSTIVSLSGVTISNAQLSKDGQNVLFLSQIGGHPAIQMIRLDGQGLQTLYCGSARNGIPANISHLVWSPNQQRAVFLEPNPGGGPGAPIVQLLTLSTGKVQTEITPTNRSGYLPQTWLSDTQVYLTGFYSNQAAPPHDVYLLDVKNAPAQNTPPQRIALIQGANWDLNLTPDGKQLILSQCAADPISADSCSAPSLMSAQPATGGTLQIVYASHVHAVTAVRVIDAHTLLFIIGGKYGAEPSPYDHNLAPGLWKIQVDGTHLTQLSREGRFLSQVHATWSTVSPDGKHYAAGGYNTVGSQLAPRLFYGSLAGGPITSFAQAQVGEDLQLVGWTTLAPAGSASGAWKITASMHNARSSFSATLLKNGLVLVAGGWNGSAYLSDAELYHPATGTWTSTSNMHIARATFSATLLNDGKVLVAGGGDVNNVCCVAIAEVYDPGTGTWSETGAMTDPRAFHTATLLNNGQVLVVGGQDVNSTGHYGSNTAELYIPRTNTWAATANMHFYRLGQTETLLRDGRVLVAGGGDLPPGASAELFAWGVTHK